MFRCILRIPQSPTAPVYNFNSHVLFNTSFLSLMLSAENPELKFFSEESKLKFHFTQTYVAIQSTQRHYKPPTDSTRSRISPQTATCN